MEKNIINKLTKNFEEYSKTKNDTQYWLARDLQKLLGYSEWRKFQGVIEKAKISCETAKYLVSDHFVGADKMVDIGSKTSRKIEDVILTRYACYLIAQNGDSRKEEIAFAQSYFAIQTRKQELIEERIKLQERLDVRNKLVESETELSKLIYERGVDSSGFARIRSKGDTALFGGHNTKQIKDKLTIPNKRPLADFLPTVTIAAKNFATEITNFNVKRDNLDGESKIGNEHIKNNKTIRKVLLDDNIIPEELEIEEDIKKLQKRVIKNEKKLQNNSNKLN